MLSSLRLLELAVGLNMSGDVGNENLFRGMELLASCFLPSLYPTVGNRASVSAIARSTSSRPVDFPERAVDASARKTSKSKL